MTPETAAPPVAAVVLGTRASALARAQTERVAESLRQAWPEIVCRTKTDRNARRPDAGQRRAAACHRGQGPLHGRAGAGAPCRHDRPRRPLAEGPPDGGDAGYHARRRLPARGREGLRRRSGWPKLCGSSRRVQSSGRAACAARRSSWASATISTSARFAGTSTRAFARCKTVSSTRWCLRRRVSVGSGSRTR